VEESARPLGWERFSLLVTSQLILVLKLRSLEMQQRSVRSSIALLAGLSLVVASCGSDSSAEPDTTESTTAETLETADDDTNAAVATTEPVAAEELPTIVVTTNILGDVVGKVVGDAANVVTVMPVGADPHDFQVSAQNVDAMMSADALIANGEGFEEGLLDVIDSATNEGVPTFEAMSAVETIEFGEGGHDHDDEDHGDEDHGDEATTEDEDEDEDHEHDHSGVDPHFFTDPMRMAAAVEGIVDFLQAEVAFADAAALDASAEAYIDELVAVDAEVEGLVGLIPEDNRVLVTNHEVFGYFADRYGFEIVGVVVPGGGTTDSVSAGELAELAEVVGAEGVAAIFADTSSSDQLVQTLAAEVGDIEVVSLYTESLGDADSEGATYLDMVRTNGQRISDALA
jgi:zinc/manganese transport system substrate-binding protein